MFVTTQGLEGALSERWGGRGWAIEAADQGIGGSSLQGAECPSVRLCFAVGAVGVGTGGATTGNRPTIPAALVERWEHGAWSIQQTPATWLGRV
jgi:hypothetical protein